MTTEERVLTALRCEQPDRVPVFIYLNPYVEYGFAKDPSYAGLLAATRQYADVIYDWYYPAGVFCTAADLPRESHDLGNGTMEQVLHTPRGPVTYQSAADWRGGGTIKHWVETEEDALRFLSIPYVPPRPDLAPFLETRQRIHDCAVAQVTFPDPICMVGGLVRPEVLALWTLQARGLVQDMLSRLTTRITDMLRYCLEGGVGPIYYFNGPEYALPPLMSPTDFDEFVVQIDQGLVALVKSYPGQYAIVHSHGRVGKFLERFAEIGMDGLNVLEPPPIGDTILSDAKKRIGDKVCLIGNVQYDDIARGTPASVEGLVRRAIREGGPGGGFILSPCASPYESPLPAQAAENIIGYLKAGRTWGQYPLSAGPGDGD